MKIYLFEHEDEEGIGLMALDETGALELEKTYAPGNKITPEWIADQKFDVALNSGHTDVNVIYVKDPDEHHEIPKLYAAWQSGSVLQVSTAEPEELDPNAVELLRASAHLCPNCIMQPLCSVAQSIGTSEHVTLAVLSHCNAYSPKEPHP